MKHFTDNTRLLMGGGVCGAIFETAAAKDLQGACDQIGDCPTGTAVITPGFSLCQSPYLKLNS